jgi:hypothetical protein
VNPQFMRYYLIIAVVTDLFLIVYLSTLIDEIGILFFLFMVIILLGGTFFLYSILKRNNG